MQERRRGKRIKKSLYVQCRLYDTTGPWLSAIVQNISEFGIKISTMKEFATGEILDIKISTFLGPRRINILGKVLSREEKRAKGAIWISRISFTNASQEDKLLLGEFIQIFSGKE